MKMRKVKQMPTIAPAKPKATGTQKLQGFDSVEQFMEKCKECGMTAEKSLYSHKGNVYSLITTRMNNPVACDENGNKIIAMSWHLLDSNETKQIAEGCVRGRDAEVLYADIDKVLDKVS